jgi:hypothetical protein
MPVYNLQVTSLRECTLSHNLSVKEGKKKEEKMKKKFRDENKMISIAFTESE